MFYSQDILQKRGGKFGIVWIAATSGKLLNRRDFASVNVNRTCDEILDIIFLRAAPKRPGDARLRLSLYLSAQLLYGLVRVYSKQREYLLMDVSAMSTKCRVATSFTDEIDLKGFPRADTVTNPDIAALSTREGPCFDPTFGVFLQEAAPVTFDIIPEMEIWKIQPSPEVLLSPRPSPPPFKPEPGSPHTVSSSDITMVEDMEPKPTEVPGEEDLPALSAEELQMLIQDIVLDERRLSPTQAASTPIHTALTESGLEGLPRETLLPVLEETPIGEHRTESPVPARVRRGQRPSPGVTPQPPQQKRSHKRKRESLELELSPNVTPSPRAQRRKRRLLFTDRETQISKTVIRENMKTSKSTCRDFELPAVTPTSVTSLFSRPTRQELRHPKLVRLWNRNTFALPYKETDSDRDHPIWTVPDLSVDKSTTSGEEELRLPEVENVEVPVPDLTGSDMELAREASVTMERSRQHDTTPLNVTSEKSLQEARERSHTSLTEEPHPIKRQKVSVGISSEDELAEHLQEATGGDVEEMPEFGRSRSRLGEKLYAHPEVPEEEPRVESLAEPRPHDHAPSHTVEDFIRSVAMLTAREKWTTFRLICPLHTLRPAAAKMFTILLDLCVAKKVQCRQKESFSNIYISRGEMW